MASCSCSLAVGRAASVLSRARRSCRYATATWPLPLPALSALLLPIRKHHTQPYRTLYARSGLSTHAITGLQRCLLVDVPENIVDVAVDDSLSAGSVAQTAAAQIADDGFLILNHLQTREKRAGEPGPWELSVLLCDDVHIARLNFEYRRVKSPTDVLSFGVESPPGYPYQLLGDVVISLQTAERQAGEQKHLLRDEVRRLLVHGVLHLLGHDHELGEKEAQHMAALENDILLSLGWQGSGLVAAASKDSPGDVHKAEQESRSADFSEGQEATEHLRVRRHAHAAEVKLLALDMDGTLLDSSSQVLESSVEAIRAAIAAGTMVCLATGKARPAAITAMTRVGLAGSGLAVSTSGPGLFLQGLAVHGGDGRLLEGPDLPTAVVRAAFEYAGAKGVSLAAFLGDSCATLQMTPELEELHFRYYEPLCQEVTSLEALLQGPPVKKLLFMTEADDIAQQHQPYWLEAVRGQQAETTMAVPNMLEIVPKGINKWVGMQLLLRDLHLSPQQLMSCGDGANDLQLVANSGLGIAMGNAVPQVKEAAKFVVSSNDDGGIAEAIEEFIL